MSNTKISTAKCLRLPIAESLAEGEEDLSVEHFLLRIVESNYSIVLEEEF